MTFGHSCLERRALGGLRVTWGWPQASRLSGPVLLVMQWLSGELFAGCRQQSPSKPPPAASHRSLTTGELRAAGAPGVRTATCRRPRGEPVQLARWAAAWAAEAAVVPRPCLGCPAVVQDSRTPYRG